MSEFTASTGWDASCYSTSPNKNRSNLNYLSVASDRQSFVWLRVPGVKRDDLQVGRLRLTVRGDFPGTTTLTVRRVNQSWKTGTITWNNRPGVASGTATITVSNVKVGDEIEVDVTNMVASALKGLPYYGLRIESSSATPLYLGAFEGGYGPELYVQTGQAPAAPSSLTPADGVIGKAKWVCSADFTDHVGDTDLAYMQVQVDPAANGTAPGFDTGAVAVEAPMIDLADTAYTGLASGATTQWRCRFQDGSGFWSPWSDWVSVTYRPKGTVTITNPTGGIVGTPTPEIVATFSGTATAFRTSVTGVSRSNIRYDSWRRKPNADGSLSVEVPTRWDGKRPLYDDGTYQARVRVWDSYDRVASVGDPTYAEAWVTFKMDDDNTQTAPDSLTVTIDGIAPVALLTFHRAVQPDQFLIIRDNKVVELVDAADIVQPGGVTYAYSDTGVTGYRPHTWRVHAVTSGKRSARTSKTATIEPEGVWLMSEDSMLRVLLSEVDSVDTPRNTDQAGSYDVLGRRFSTRVVTALGGRRAQGMTFAITDEPADGRTWMDYEADMLTIKENQQDAYRYYSGADNLLVRVSNVTVSTRSDTLPGQIRCLVAFDMEQIGDYEYDGRV